MRLSLIFCLLTGIVWGQNDFTIKGLVLDESGKALPQASITLTPVEIHTTSDEDGFYQFSQVPQGKYVLQCQYTGYQDVKMEINVDKNSEINFHLKETAFAVSGITTTAMHADRDNTPVTFSEISNKMIIDTYEIQDVPMTLQFTPGAFAYSETGTGIGYTHFNIRGFHQQRMNIMVNGIPLNDPEGHGVYWVDMPDLMNNTKDIQIQRGVGFSTDGSAAFGGSINLRTDPLSTRRKISFEAGYGSYNSRKLSTAYESGLIGNMSFSGRFSKVHSDGYRERTAADLYSWFLSGGYMGKKTTLQFNAYGGLEITQLAWNGANPDMIRADRRANDTEFDNEIDHYLQPHFEFLLNHAFSSELSLAANIFFVHGEGYFEQFKKAGDYPQAEILLPDSIETDKFIRKWLKNDHFGAQATLTWNSAYGKTTGGLLIRRYIGDHFGDIIQAKDVDFSVLNSPIRFYSNTGYKNYISTFVNQIYPLNKKLNLMADLQLRYIDYRRVQDKMTVYPGYRLSKNNLFLNPKLGILYQFDKGLNFFASVGISNREPSGNDYFDPKDPGATPNNDIHSERVYDFETGLRFDIPDIAGIDLNLYYMSFENEIVANGQVDDEGNYIHVNAKNSFRSGIELALNGSLEKLNYSINGAFSYNRISEYTEYIDLFDSDWNYIATEEHLYKDVKPAYAPEVVFNSSLGYDFEYFKLILQHQFVGEQYVDNTQSPGAKVDPYSLLNLLVNIPLSLGESNGSVLSLRINNLLNADYWQPAYVWWKWRQDGVIHYDTRYYVGAPRNYYVSLKLNL